MCINSVILLVLLLAIAFFRSFRHCDFEAQASMQDFIVSSRAEVQSEVQAKYLAILSSISIFWVSFLNIGI